MDEHTLEALILHWPGALFGILLRSYRVRFARSKCSSSRRPTAASASPTHPSIAPSCRERKKKKKKHGEPIHQETTSSKSLWAVRINFSTRRGVIASDKRRANDLPQFTLLTKFIPSYYLGKKLRNTFYQKYFRLLESAEGKQKKRLNLHQKI